MEIRKCKNESAPTGCRSSQAFSLREEGVGLDGAYSRSLSNGGSLSDGRFDGSHEDSKKRRKTRTSLAATSSSTSWRERRIGVLHLDNLKDSGYEIHFVFATS